MLDLRAVRYYTKLKYLLESEDFVNVTSYLLQGMSEYVRGKR